MTVFQPDIPPDVAEVVRHLPPDVKRSVKRAIRALSLNPDAGEPLRRALEGLWKYRAKRFRIVYTLASFCDSSGRRISILVWRTLEAEVIRHLLPDVTHSVSVLQTRG